MLSIRIVQAPQKLIRAKSPKETKNKVKKKLFRSENKYIL